MKALTMKARGSGCALLALSAVISTGSSLASDEHLVLPPLNTISTIASTVPSNGDVNPYGMAQVKRTTGKLHAGHILVSNFNNSANLQGTGTTIVDVGPDGSLSLFATIDATALPGSCPGGVGLTTALVVLEQGWVIVGSLPTTDGTSATAGAGCLIVLDRRGKVVETFSGSLINGPWDMTAFDGEREAKLFVTNVLNDTVSAGGLVVNEGTVTRLDLKVSASAKPVLESISVIASGFPERTDQAALVIGPTGVALRAHCASDGDDCENGEDGAGALLYVADTLSNRIAVIDHPLGRTTSAGIGRTLSAGGSLNGPLGLIVTPSGELLTVNSGDGFITEISPGGAQRATVLLDSTGSPPSQGAGTLFGLVFDPAHGVYFVDDGTNIVNLLH
jgi:DNA-binding beta-propeller fold protein YncE